MKYDNTPIVPTFTLQKKVNMDVNQKSTQLDILSAFLDNEFYWLVTQTIYTQSNIWNLVILISQHANKLKDVTKEVKRFFALHFFTEAWNKPALEQPCTVKDTNFRRGHVIE